MLAILCACLFGLAAFCAVASMLATLTGYAPDIARLRRARFAAVPKRHVVWRIIEPFAPVVADARGAAIRDARPAGFPAFGPAITRPSLAA